MSWILGVQHGLGPARPPTSIMPGGATRPPNAALWADESGDITIENDLTVTGATVLVGGETFQGLVTVTSAASAGAAGAFGPEELQYETTQAATAGATIRNPGYVDWKARTWETATSTSTTQLFGRFGAVIDTITAATGVPATYRLAWANTAGTIVTALTEVGAVQAGAGTEALPGVCGLGDTNTGLRWNADDTLTMITAGADRWRVGATGHLLAVDDALYDIGASGATRPANLFLSGDATIGGLTANSMIYPGAGGLLTDTVAATNGQILVGSTGAAPALATLTATANQTTVTNGAASITVGAAQDIATGSSPTFANVTIATAGALRTATAAGNTLLLQARDVDGAAYTTFATLTANDTPTMDLADTVTKGGTYIYRASGTDVAVVDGGTGLSSWTANALCYASAATTLASLGAATNGQIPIGSTAAAPVLATLTGTASQITVTNGAGTITLATPQNIHTAATPTFAGMTLTGQLDWTTGEAVTAGEYSVGRDADGTNQLHCNVPTGGTFEWSVNDVAQMTLSTTGTLAAAGSVSAANGAGTFNGATFSRGTVGVTQVLGTADVTAHVRIGVWDGDLGDYEFPFICRAHATAPELAFTRVGGAGAAGVLGPETAIVENTQAATAGATIRNPGYLTFSGRMWETGGGTSTTQKFGRLGAVVDTITAATGVPATYRLAWANTAGTIQWSVTEQGSPGFWATTPPTSRTTYTQTFATADATHAAFTSADLATTAATQTSPWGFASQAQAEAIATQFNALRVDVDDLKRLANSIIDDLQAYGLAA